METTTVQPQNLPRLDDQNPWPGLAAYDEASRAFFHGRQADVDALLRLIRHAPLAVMYGKSGLGKTSLLLAGLFPKLREAHFFPVYLHIDFSAKAEGSFSEQVLQRMEAEMALSGADYPPRTPEEGLWQYLHRKDMEIWSPDNFPLTPVLVFDQFEELFSRSGGDRSLIRSVLDNLADLIENRIPPEIAVADRMMWERLDFFVQRYRILLAFREDFLPEFEAWKDSVPSLLRNRLRLLPMSREQAIAAIHQAGAAVLKQGVAERIADFVANRVDKACQGETVVEPVLLSLCCYQLNLNRIQAGADRIDATLVESSGQNILLDFYHQAINGLPENVSQFIETHLIQGDRYRGTYPLQEAIEQKFIQQEDLNRLIGRFRLLRVNQQADTARIELIHDRLVSVVRQSRDDRLAHAREQKEQLLRKDAEREARIEIERREQAERDRSRMGQMRNWLLGLSLVLSVAIVFAFYQENIANTQRRAAEEQTITAKNQRLLATVLRLVAEAQSIISRVRIESEERAFLQLLAAFRILPETETKDGRVEVESALLDALLKQRDLVKLMITGVPAMAVAFSSDGSRVVSARRDRKRQVWDADTGKPIEDTPTESMEDVSCLAFSPDFSRMASGSQNNSMLLWNAVSGKPIGEPLTGHTDEVTCMAFNSDGSRIVSGSQDKTVRLWDAETGRAIGEMTGHGDAVMSVAFSSNGARIVSGSKDRALRLWDAETGRAIGEMTGHDNVVSCVAFSPDGKRIVSGSWDKSLRVWDPDSLTVIGEPLTGHKEAVSCMAFSPDGKRIVSGSWDKTLLLWDAVNGKPLERLQLAHKGAVNSVAFSPDGTRIVSGSQDNSLRLWNASFSAPMQGHADWVNSVAFSPDGKRIVSGSGDRTLRLWNAATGLAIGDPLSGHQSRVESVAFSADGTRIVSGSQDKSLRLWDAETGLPIGDPLSGHSGAVTTAVFSFDGTRIVSGSQDKSLRLWDAETGLPIGGPLTGHTDGVSCVAFSPDDTRILSGSGDRTLRLWDTATGLPVGDPLSGHEAWVMSIAFSPDGSRIASGSWDASLRLWDTGKRQPICKPLTGHEDAVMSVAFSPDGKRIVSGSWDSCLRLWDGSTGQPISGPLQGHDGRVQSVAFSPDGKRIVSGSGDRTLRLWPVPGDLAEELCKKLTRNMSRREWREWVSPDIDYVRQCPDLPEPPEEP